MWMDSHTIPEWTTVPSGGNGHGTRLPAETEAMRRVVVTGLGVVAPNGVGKEAFWSACLNGRSGVGPIRTFDASRHPVRVAAEIPDFDVTPFVPEGQRKSLKIMSRAMRFAVRAEERRVGREGRHG